MSNQLIIQNPKRTVGSNSGKSTWYDYYASYSAQFVYETLLNTNLPADSSVMDPWNGSGTTTQIAEEMGYVPYGYDINPVMIIVAKAKRLDRSVKDSLLSVSNDIIKKSKRYRKSLSVCDVTDPLETWFTRETVNRFRNLELGIQQLLINDITGRKYLREVNMDIISSLAAFYYVALFRTIRNFLTNYKCSNPTWIKVPKVKDKKVEVSAYEINNSFQKNGNLMKDAFNETCKIVPNLKAVLKVASSTSIPLSEKQIDMVITSPPYCTRIDYVVNTLPELALLGFFPSRDVQKIRNEMIGTPTIINSALTTETVWGSTCWQFIEQVRNHDSKASKSYYLKNYLQYFDGIYKSLKEIDRTLKNTGKCIFVLQDSYYKEIHLDLVSIYSEMVDSLSWILENKKDFTNRHSMSTINKNAGKYRKPARAIESVLIFRKQ